MNKAIVTTTINGWTEALDKFSQIEGWDLIIIGDQKTPREAFYAHEGRHVAYFSPEAQMSLYPALSEAIGWNCIQRRNIGFAVAYESGYDVIATVDDDNIPLPGWGENLSIGKPTVVDLWESGSEFDPLSVTAYRDILRHRGFPHDTHTAKLWTRRSTIAAVLPTVQADLWNGAPDIDGIQRALYPELEADFESIRGFYAAPAISPFNSQNTFLSRDMLPNYFMYPGIGRFDDIWASYYLQKQPGVQVVYGPPSVYQKRNPHDVYKDIEAELYGYRNTRAFLNGEDVLPDVAKRAFEEYQKVMW